MKFRLARWFVPSLTHWLWLMLLVVLIGHPWRTAMVAGDGDANMHWRVGKWMLQHGQMIRADEFSHTRPGAPVISKEWLSEIIFAATARVPALEHLRVFTRGPSTAASFSIEPAALFGIALVAALIIATTLALLHRQLLHEGNDALASTIVTLFAAWATSAHWLARPHVFSFLAMFLWNDALRRFERDGKAGKLALSLGMLTLFWVNLHGGYLAGFLVLGAYWLGAIIERDLRRLKALTVISLLCVLVSLANPNGYRLLVHNVEFLRSDFFKNWLAEYGSTNFQLESSHGFLAWLAFMFLTLAWLRPRLTASGIVLVLSWTYFALYAGRNIPLLAILTAPLLAPAISNALRQRLPALCERLRATNASARGWPVVTVLALAIIAVPHPTEMPSDGWPVDAAQFIKQQPGKFAGNMFNQYAWGGYLMQELPEHKVFVDGRADFYGRALLEEFDQVTGLRTNWLGVLEERDVRWTLMPADHRLNSAVALIPSWSCVYSDNVALIYRRSP